MCQSFIRFIEIKKALISFQEKRFNILAEYGALPVQQNFENFIIILVSCEDERSDVGSVLGSHGIDGFPGVRSVAGPDTLLVLQQQFNTFNARDLVM